MQSISDIILTNLFMWKDFDTKKRLPINKEIIARTNKKAIFFFPFWTGKSKIYKRLSKQFPDHTKIYFDYPNEIMSEDVKVSTDYISRIIDDSFQTIKQLKKEGYNEIILVGSSFGSNIALKLSTMVEVDKIILNMIDKNFASSIFQSPALKVLRKKLEKQGFTFNKTNKIYNFISTDHIVPKIKNKKNIKFLIFISRTDIFCTYQEFAPELKEFDKNKIKYKLIINILGHILSIYKNLYFNKKIVEFIKG